MAKSKLPAWATWSPDDKQQSEQQANSNEDNFLNVTKNFLINKDSQYPMEESKLVSQYNAFKKNNPMNLPQMYGGTAPNIFADNTATSSTHKKVVATPAKESYFQSVLNGDKQLNLSTLLGSKAPTWQKAVLSPLAGIGTVGNYLNDQLENNDGTTSGNKFTGRLLDTARSAATAGAVQPTKQIDTGNKVENFVADMLGSAGGFSVPNGGLSMGNSIAPIGEGVEKGVTKLLPTFASPVANKLAGYGVNALKGATEFGTLNGVESGLNGDNAKTVLKNIGSGALQGALFNTGAKAIGDIGKSAFPAFKTTYESSSPLINTPKDLKFNQIKNISNTVFDTVKDNNGNLIKVPRDVNFDVRKPIQPLNKLDSILKPQNADINVLNKGNAITPSFVQNGTVEPVTNTKDVVLNNNLNPFTKNSQFIDNSIQNSKVKPNIMKDRQTIVNSFINSEAIPQEVKNKLVQDPQSYKYIEHNNEQAMMKARAMVAEKPSEAMNHINGLKSLETDTDTATAIELERKLILDGDFEGAKNLSLKVARLGTNSGQAIQYFSTLKKMTPEWTLNHVQNMINKTLTPRQNEILNSAKPQEVDSIAKKFNIPHLSNEATKTLTDMSNRIGELPEGREKQEAIANLQQYAKNQVPSNTLSKINSIQILSMLSSPKTAIRNSTSNAIFGGISDIKNTLRTGIDKGVSVFTGNRTSTLPSLSAKLQGFNEGFKNDVLDFKNNVNTRDSQKMELGQGSIWNKDGNIPNKLMYGIEKTQRLALSDRPFEGAAYADEMVRQKQLSLLNKTEFKPDEAMTKAKEVAAYQTFNDKSYLSNLAITIKRTLNGGKEWGAGDILMKFAKVPANLAQRSYDYSIGGFTNAAKAAFGKEGFNQEKFADELAKGATGAGIVGIGSALYKMGVLNTDEEKNTNAQALKTKAGLGDFQINMSALNRVLHGGSSKLEKGDLMATYDWSAPTSMLLALGANLNSKNKSITNQASSVVDGLVSGINGFVNQPLLQGIQTLTGSHNFGQAGASLLAGIPSTFVPSIANNFKQLINNENKETYSPNIFQKGANQALSRLPWNTLPQKVDIMGKPKETFQNGSNNLFNVFLNPANTTKYSPDKSTENALNLYNKTGNGDVLPKLVNKSITVDKNAYKLPLPIYQSYQKELGTAINNIYSDSFLTEKEANSAITKASKKALDNVKTKLNFPLLQKPTSKGHHYTP